MQEILSQLKKKLSLPKYLAVPFTNPGSEQTFSDWTISITSRGGQTRHFRYAQNDVEIRFGLEILEHKCELVHHVCTIFIYPDIPIGDGANKAKEV